MCGTVRLKICGEAVARFESGRGRRRGAVLRCARGWARAVRDGGRKSAASLKPSSAVPGHGIRRAAAIDSFMCRIPRGDRVGRYHSLAGKSSDEHLVLVWTRRGSTWRRPNDACRDGHIAQNQRGPGLEMPTRRHGRSLTAEEEWKTHGLPRAGGSRTASSACSQLVGVPRSRGLHCGRDRLSIVGTLPGVSGTRSSEIRS